MGAPALFDDLMRATVVPALRELGFRGSGQSFSLPDAVRWELLGFQRHRLNHPGSAMFTVNLLCVERADWSAAREAAPSLPASPSASVSWGPGRHERVGFLLDPAHDHWWELRTQDDREVVGQQVVEVLRELAVPWLVAGDDGAGRPPRGRVPAVGESWTCPLPGCPMNRFAP